MGKKKIDNVKFVEDKNQRNVTYSKRKRGILKKAIELSSLCGQNIYLVIFDKEKQKLIEFRSKDEFNSGIVASLTQKDIVMQFKHEVYTNKDYNRFLHAADDDKGGQIVQDNMDAVSVDSNIELEDTKKKPAI